MKRVLEYIDYLTKGTLLRAAQLPQTDNTATLLADLKRYGFVSADTSVEHFRVLFGIPLHISDTPFEPIKWKKNKQLLRYFLCSLYPKDDVWMVRLLCPKLIADKHGEKIGLAQSDKKRLEQSSDFDTLVKVLKRFNG